MGREEIFNIIVNIAREVTSKNDLLLTEESIFTDIENWDSLNTVDLEIDIEANFDVDFETGEFQTYKSVGALLDAIEKKLAS